MKKKSYEKTPKNFSAKARHKNFFSRTRATEKKRGEEKGQG
jgi:hypothetical protein